MRFIATTALVFATAAIAAPAPAPAEQAEQAQQAQQGEQGTQDFGPGFGGSGFDGNNWWNPNPGPYYRQSCTCQVNGQIMPWLGTQACQSLGSIWGNLQPDAFGNCRDLAQQGLEPNGFEAACQRVAGQQGPGWQPGWWGQNGNNRPFNPQAIRGVCTPF